MTVSVLIAVYNASRYLPQCLDSLLTQSHTELDIICVDDCSTDGSWEVLTDYARRDSRIHLLRQPSNQGQAKARNAALKEARGEYVMMLDSDDWLAPDAVEQCLATFEGVPETDCVLFRLMMTDEEGNNATPYANKTDKKVLTGQEAFRLSLNWSLHGVYMVRADIHKAYPYDDSCRLYSDDNTTHIHYLHSRHVALSEGEYFYRQHPASATATLSIRRFDMMESNLHLKQLILKEKEDGTLSPQEADEALNLFETQRWLNLVDCYWLLFRNRELFTPEERQSIVHSIQTMLPTIERARIPWRLKLKPGYWPFRPLWLFRLWTGSYLWVKRKTSNIGKRNGS